MFIFSGNKCHHGGWSRTSFVCKEKKQGVLLLHTWEYLTLSFHPRPLETAASHACAAPAPRRVETYSAFLWKERAFCPFRLTLHAMASLNMGLVSHEGFTWIFTCACTPAALGLTFNSRTHSVTHSLTQSRWLRVVSSLLKAMSLYSEGPWL